MLMLARTRAIIMFESANWKYDIEVAGEEHFDDRYMYVDNVVWGRCQDISQDLLKKTDPIRTMNFHKKSLWQSVK